MRPKHLVGACARTSSEWGDEGIIAGHGSLVPTSVLLAVAVCPLLFRLLFAGQPLRRPCGLP